MKYLIILTLLLLNPSTHAEEDDKPDVFFDGTKTVHFKFTDVVDGKYNYTVDVIWTPNSYLAIGEGSPAILRFSEKEWLNSFSVTTSAFDLSGDVLKKAGYYTSDDWGYHKDILSTVFTIDYKSLSKSSLIDNAHGGDAPFFFEDVDFDNINNLVVLESGVGQRSVDAYKIYNFNSYGGRVPDLYSVVDKEPYTWFDTKTKINKEDKSIAFFSSGGACSSRENTYKRVGDQLKYIKYKKWRESTSKKLGFVCTESTYDIVDGKQVLESETDSFYDDDKHKWVEVCDEAAAVHCETWLAFIMRNDVCLAGGFSR